MTEDLIEGKVYACLYILALITERHPDKEFIIEKVREVLDGGEPALSVLTVTLSRALGAGNEFTYSGMKQALSDFLYKLQAD